MPGGVYVALSGMRTRLDALDRLSSDIANSGTAGYKAERSSNAEATRSPFAGVLDSAIDVTTGTRRLNATAGAIAPTGRNLDVAVEGDGFLVVQSPAGVRYTRNGHLQVRTDGVLTTDDGAVVQGANGPIKVGTGKVEVGQDGTVQVSGAVVGKLSVVKFDDPGTLVREGASLLRGDPAKAQPVTLPSVRGGSLEQSNVSVVERIAELTDVMRTFEALQKALTLQMNDIDGRAIDTLGRR
ncbi:MAG: flagellar hook basal-body protein [Acidobacteriota bacterium]